MTLMSMQYCEPMVRWQYVYTPEAKLYTCVWNRKGISPSRLFIRDYQ